MGFESVHSCLKVLYGMRGSSEFSVDHCRMGMNEVEGQVSSEAVDRSHALEQDEHNQAQKALGKVWL